MLYITKAFSQYIVLTLPAKIFDDTYLLEHNHVSRRSVDPHAAAHAEVSEHPAVSWAEQQRVLSRQKRQLWRLPPPTLPPPEHYENDLNLNDERYKWQLRLQGFIYAIRYTSWVCI